MNLLPTHPVAHLVVIEGVEGLNGKAVEQRGGHIKRDALRLRAEHFEFSARFMFTQIEQ